METNQLIHPISGKRQPTACPAANQPPPSLRSRPLALPRRSSYKAAPRHEAGEAIERSLTYAGRRASSLPIPPNKPKLITSPRARGEARPAFLHPAASDDPATTTSRHGDEEGPRRRARRRRLGHRRAGLGRLRGDRALRGRRARRRGRRCGWPFSQRRHRRRCARRWSARRLLPRLLPPLSGDDALRWPRGAGRENLGSASCLVHPIN